MAFRGLDLSRRVPVDISLGNLDAALRSETRVEISELHQRMETTMIYVTHDQVEAMTMADRIVVLNAGKIEQAGTPTEIYSKPATRFVADFIGDNNLLAVSARGGQVRLGQTDLGRADIPDGEHLIAVRPEHLRLLSADDEQPGLLAKVSLVRSLGAMLETEAQVDGLTLVQTAMTNSAGAATGAKVGDQIKVAFDLGQLWVIPK